MSLRTIYFNHRLDHERNFEDLRRIINENNRMRFNEFFQLRANYLMQIRNDMTCIEKRKIFFRYEISLLCSILPSTKTGRHSFPSKDRGKWYKTILYGLALFNFSCNPISFARIYSATHIFLRRLSRNSHRKDRRLVSVFKVLLC